ncbi:hypothetical protein N7448_008595 [Penicillium atrosanguineum]|uniref:uncharacterized protein n=1 Tax=Penicillium atrosanguineum TaxID=1132637 RepID=UPI0023836EBE|nr:uncharacterized protein N7443_000389 [Penicillium atrosanguineum]KAJ5127816.1 hypothetical protein N7448_008595 [Penicillium atrosanguineum]KAJ5148024.1 hypothetical protein N7526_001376 [Penicillium atrosanguineum]KAJ5313505.1 hypothetical protein N7443_000389 [Penicillium atrosanguineum]
MSTLSTTSPKHADDSSFCQTVPFTGTNVRDSKLRLQGSGVIHAEKSGSAEPTVANAKKNATEGNRLDIVPLVQHAYWWKK